MLLKKNSNLSLPGRLAISKNLSLLTTLKDKKKFLYQKVNLLNNRPLTNKTATFKR